MGYRTIASKELHNYRAGAQITKKVKLLLRDTGGVGTHLVIQSYKGRKLEKQIYLNEFETLQLGDFLKEHRLMPSEVTEFSNYRGEDYDVTLPEDDDYDEALDEE